MAGRSRAARSRGCASTWKALALTVADGLDRILDLLALEVDASSRLARFTIVDAAVNPNGGLFGGAAVAASIALMERVTERPVLWTTVQFVTRVTRGEVVACEVDVLAHGARMSQVRVTGTQGDDVVFIALGATGMAREDDRVAFDRMPVVPPPELCPPAIFNVGGDLERSYFSAIDRRVAAEPAALAGTRSDAAWWVQVPGLPASAALLGYFGDVAAFGMFRALGRPDARATSIDNTLRIGPAVDTDWVLLDVRTQLIVGGYGHGTVYLWAPDGTLMGMMSQTVAFRSTG